MNLVISIWDTLPVHRAPCRGESSIFGGGAENSSATGTPTTHWIGDLPYGLSVIEATMAYLNNLGGNGDAEHPAPGTRAAQILTWLRELRWRLDIYNDDVTPLRNFVRAVLAGLQGPLQIDPASANLLIAKVEREGHAVASQSDDYSTVREIVLKIRETAAEQGFPFHIEMTNRVPAGQ